MLQHRIAYKEFEKQPSEARNRITLQTLKNTQPNKPRMFTCWSSCCVPLSYLLTKKTPAVRPRHNIMYNDLILPYSTLRTGTVQYSLSAKRANLQLTSSFRPYWQTFRRRTNWFMVNSCGGCDTLPMYIIRTVNVEPSRRRGSGRTGGMYVARYIGKMDTVEEESRRSPE